MRAVKSEADLSLHNSQFRNQIADLSATIHARPKDELIGEGCKERITITSNTTTSVTIDIYAPQLPSE